jgi:ParB family chromosome partitioning protein
MPKASRDKLKGKGKIDVTMFDPEDVVLVEDKTAALYDKRVEDGFDEKMVLNMMYAPDGVVPQGVLVPLTGRRNTETQKVEITAGRRRTLSAREANKRLDKQGIDRIRLPVWVRRANDDRAMANMISENEHRLADSPMGRAQKMQRYLDRGKTEGEIAVLFGVSESTVKNHLALLDAPAVVRHAVDAGKISASDGYKLARQEPDEAKKKLGELLEKAPRTPGKKRNKNAKKAREIVHGGAEKKSENAVAEAIAAWIEATWNDKGDWGGAPSEIPALIRSGEWRKQPVVAEDAAE